MIDTQAIKNKVLNLAMRGQLTEQMPEDGTAKELFNQIQAEKKMLAESGQIKSEKQLPQITEIPFDIPESWLWVRWGSLSFRIQYGYNAPAKEKGRIKMVRITDIQDNKVLWKTVPFCDIEEDSIDEYRIKPNNILFARTGGTVGKSYLVENVDEDAVFAGYLIRTDFSSMLCAKYMKYFMGSQLYWKQLQDGTTATAQPNCNAKTLSKMVVPLPPVSEQARIVERIEAVFEIIDKIDALQSQYALNQEALKRKMIDAAVQGKMTEQLPEDGTADEFYEKIQKEKSKLIKEGKIKKDKPLPGITDIEIPFEIPENWKWVRFGNLMRNRDSERVPVSLADRKKIKKIYDYYGASGVIDRVEEYLFDGKLLLIGEDGANLLSRSTPIAFIANGRYWVNNHAHVLDCYYSDYLDYVMHYINSISLVPYVTGSAQPKLNQDNMNKIPIPLPPLSEMRRIVGFIDSISKIANVS